MRNYLLTFLAIFFLLIACSRVPVTGRKQLQLVSENELVQMSLVQYNQFLSESQIVENTPDAQMLDRVGQNIIAAATEYLKKRQQFDRIRGYEWEFNLVQDPAVNAFAMPGGKVVFFSGIMPIAGDETGVAVVMSHEIAHVIARHGNERMSQLLAAELGGVGLSVALSTQPQQTRDLYLTAYGLGTQLGVLLPYSRTHESEADEIGLIFMAMAGYDPSAALDFWTRMKERSGGNNAPNFLATHPTHDVRLEKIREALPLAMQVYQQNKDKRR